MRDDMTPTDEGEEERVLARMEGDLIAQEAGQRYGSLEGFRAALVKLGQEARERLAESATTGCTPLRVRPVQFDDVCDGCGSTVADRELVLGAGGCHVWCFSCVTTVYEAMKAAQSVS